MKNMRATLTLALILVTGGILHADITLPSEACGLCVDPGLGFGPLTPVAGKHTFAEVGSPTFPLTYARYDLSSWVYRDSNGFLVFLWQLTNTTPTASLNTLSDVTANKDVWFGEAFTPYNTGNYGTGEQSGDLGATISALNTDSSNLGWGTTALAGGIDPNNSSDGGRPWNAVFYLPNNPPHPILGSIVSDFQTTNIGPGQWSTIWWVHTTARFYINGNVDLHFGINGVNTIGAGTANIESYMPTVPEPASLLLMGSGLVGLAGAMRRRMARG